MNVIFSKILVENFSDRYTARFGFLTNAGIACGVWVCFSMGVLLPDFEDVEANKTNETWRIIFMTPAILGLFVMIMFLCVYKEDTIIYCVQMGLKNEARSAMRRLYRLKDEKTSNYQIDDVFEAHYNYLRKNVNIEASTTTFKQALFDRKYRKATWICFCICCFG